MTPRLLAFVAVGALSVGLGACGSEDRKGLIPAGDAQSLSDRLDTVNASVADGECGPLPQELSRLRGAVAALPSTVDDRLRRRLDQGVTNLAQISPDACQEAALGATEAPEETTTAEPETTTTAIPTTTVPVEPTTTTPTEPPPTTTPTTPATTPELPPQTGGTPADPGNGEAGDGE